MIYLRNPPVYFRKTLAHSNSSTESYPLLSSTNFNIKTITPITREIAVNQPKVTDKALQNTTEP